MTSTTVVVEPLSRHAAMCACRRAPRARAETAAARGVCREARARAGGRGRCHAGAGRRLLAQRPQPALARPGSRRPTCCPSRSPTPGAARRRRAAAARRRRARLRDGGARGAGAGQAAGRSSAPSGRARRAASARLRPRQDRRGGAAWRRCETAILAELGVPIPIAILCDSRTRTVWLMSDPSRPSAASEGTIQAPIARLRGLLRLMRAGARPARGARRADRGPSDDEEARSTRRSARSSAISSSCTSAPPPT